MTPIPPADAAEKRRLGAFYTRGNPFVLAGFRAWMHGVPDDAPYLEPFAGSRQIVKLMNEAGYKRHWRLYDFDGSLRGVTHQDTLEKFPGGYRVVVTNPPYLSYHFAVRKGLNPDKAYFRGYSSLYLAAVGAALASCEYVAMIIPDSFVTSGMFTERLEHVISLPMNMFDDTDMPTCLALWGPKASADYQVWNRDDRLGSAASLLSPLGIAAGAGRITFNHVAGQLGLRAIDSTQGPSIAFITGAEVPDARVRSSGRLITRIHVEGLGEPGPVIEQANQILNNWRERTADFELTAFKGTRSDGAFRRRLDFANARAILSQALCASEWHY